ncbi:MAG: RIO1 family regulatory kinase/ATPase [Candidatus Diapherotrites archaeon]|nr:RIO1 family regulatory kinase/ATPase [Candidatus Diapherotrites archaeon]
MTISARLESFLQQHQSRCVQKLGRGFAAETYLLQDAKGKKSCLKIERDDSPRRDFTYKESEHLKAANAVRVGPKLLAADYENRCIRMEYVDGTPFSKWVLDEKNPPSKAKLEKCVSGLLAQAKRLDAAGIDHGQLAGKGHNILVKKDGTPVIIDFEKSSMTRKPHNATQLESFLFKNPHSILTRTIHQKLGSDYNGISHQDHVSHC